MKKTRILVFLLISAVICLSAVQISFAAEQPVSAGNQKSFYLKTGNDPEYYAEITISGDTIKITGCFTDTVTNVRMNETPMSSQDLSVKGDGTFSATIVAKTGNPYDYLRFDLRSGAFFHYRMDYDKGWYFTDNSLDEQNRNVFDNITQAPAKAVVYYISETADRDETEQTLAKISSLTAEIVKDAQTDYEKAKLICRWVSENIYYDKDASTTSVDIGTIAAANVLESRKTVCGGYANLFCIMLESAGIKAVNIKGSSVAGDVTFEKLATGAENHEWSAFYLKDESRWVVADCCWNSRNTYSGGEYKKNHTDMQYFDPSYEVLMLVHRADKCEYREYYSALSDAEETTGTTEETTAETTTPPETTAPPENTTERTDAQTNATTTPAVTEENTNSGENSGDIVYFIVIGAIILGIITLVIVIIKQRKDNKDDSD